MEAAQANALSNILAEMATREDVRVLGEQLEAMRSSTREQLEAMRSSTREQLEAMRSTTREQLEAMKSSTREQLDTMATREHLEGALRIQTAWILSVMVALVGIMGLMAKLFA